MAIQGSVLGYVMLCTDQTLKNLASVFEPEDGLVIEEDKDKLIKFAEETQRTCNGAHLVIPVIVE